MSLNFGKIQAAALQQVGLGGTKVTDDALAALAALRATLPRCQIVHP